MLPVRVIADDLAPPSGTAANSPVLLSSTITWDWNKKISQELSMWVRDESFQKQNAKFYWTQEESWIYAVTQLRFLALSGCMKQQDWLALWIRKKWQKAPSEPDPLHPTTVENRSSSRWATYNTISTVGRWAHPGPQSSNKDGDIED